MAEADRVSQDAALPRLLYIGDVSVADTMAGEALLYRLLQFYPPERIALVCGVRPDMPKLARAAYHHWGPMFPSLLHSRVAEEYVLWRAWRYYEVPAAIERIATMFRAEAILSISHVSGWLAGWQLARQRSIPFHLIAHDDFVYASRFPGWSRRWAERKFGEAYRDAATRFCISDTMSEIYRERFGAAGEVLYPTYKHASAAQAVSPRTLRDNASLVFAYGGSINSASEMQQMVSFARQVTARGHRFVAYTPQHSELAAGVAAAGATVEAHAPVHSDELMARLRLEADCLLLPQSMAEAARASVATAFPTKWSDYSTLGLPVIVWAPPGSSSARFVSEHPGCAELVVGTAPAELEAAIGRLETRPRYRHALAETLLSVGRSAFSPETGWEKFRDALLRHSPARAAS